MAPRPTKKADPTVAEGEDRRLEAELRMTAMNGAIKLIAEGATEKDLIRQANRLYTKWLKALPKAADIPQ